MNIRDLPADVVLACTRHGLVLHPFVDRDAWGCGRGCEITGTALAAGRMLSGEDRDTRWKREHGIPVSAA